MKRYSPIKTLSRVAGLAFLSLLLYYGLWMLIDKELRFFWPFSLYEMVTDYAMCFVMALLVSVFYWRSFIKIQEERDRFKLKSLENQINPHFVFNNFSILSELIEEDKDKAQEFLMNLSKVYRYNLNNVDNTLVPIADELAFLQQYVHILETRFGQSFSLGIDDNLIEQKGFIPPCSLQMLVENAIKHNEHTLDRPLLITIDCDWKRISVRNRRQPLANLQASTNVGNHNLKERYSLLTKESIIISHNEEYYSVSLPIIKEYKL